MSNLLWDQPFLTLLCLGLLVGISVRSQNSAEREGEGVWLKERCITPTATMPIVSFALPKSYDGRPTRLPSVKDSALTYRGVTEQPPGSNDGAEIADFLASVGLSGGHPYCAAFTVYVDAETCRRGPLSRNGGAIQSAGATDYKAARETLPPRRVTTNRDSVPVGSRVIWQVRGSWEGHIGFVVGDEEKGIGAPWRGQCGLTVEANTSAP